MGLKKFPELKNKYEIGNCEHIRLKETDCTVMSAVLEHVNNPNKLLVNALKSTKKIICVRTFMGINNHNALRRKDKNLLNPYPCNQFSFDYMLKKLKKFNFIANIILDKATNNSEKSLLIDKKFERKIFIILGIKK